MNRLVATITFLAGLVVIVGAMAQNLITCVKHEAVGLLTAGILCPPIAVIHGIGIWLGIFAR